MIPVRVSRNVVLMQRRFSATAWNKDTNTTPGPPVLPDLPPPVKGWPSFWMIRKEAEEYLYPLYARGWGVKFIPRWGHTSKHDLYVAHLTTDLSFANFNCAVQFITDLKKMSNEEKHHPSHLALQNCKRPILSLYVRTDSALRPKWNEEDPKADPPLSRRVPGITRRDLRFAVLTEHLYETYHKDGRALEVRGANPKHIHDRPIWPYLLSRFVRSSLGIERGATPGDIREQLLQDLEAVTGNDEVEASFISDQRQAEVSEIKCPACEGQHKIQDCSVRSQYPPPNLCTFCLKPHWWVDCPEWLAFKTK